VVTRFVDTVSGPMLHSGDEGVKAGNSVMNVMRFTIIDDEGGVSFVAHADALPALVKGCTQNPGSLGELLDIICPYYGALREYVLDGLAVFDERNVEGHYGAIHEALDFCAPHEQPVFRVVDEVTREASLRPVKAGAVLFNLPAKRIIQLQNTYWEIQRAGRWRVFDGSEMTANVFSYRLPREWAVVP
jgi:hypothetical protein